MIRKALITGITGQDGSYLAEFLLLRGYEVHGIVRRSSSFNTDRINHLYADPHTQSAKLFLHFGDLSDSTRLAVLLQQIEPDEIYNLAAQSHVRVSFDQPEYTGETTGLGTLRILEAMNRCIPSARFYQASTSEMFGAALPPQNEKTEFYPKSPYGISKLYSYWTAVNYRESYGLFVTNGILFNHESPRRGETFLTRKVTRAVVRILKGEQKELFLGNLDSRRDWGYAPEYVVSMWRMLQADMPDDYVIGTGTSLSVREFLEIAFNYVGLDWKKYVKFDTRYERPAEVDTLIADPSKARVKLGWEASIKPKELIQIMVDHDEEVLAGYKVDKPRGSVWKDALT